MTLEEQDVMKTRRATWLARLLHVGGYVWASPISLPAVLLAWLAGRSGGICQLRDGVLEGAGGWTGAMLQRLLPGFPIAAITLGHVVLASCPRTLELTRRHERVHVAQYARWGLLFPAAYALASVIAWLQGRPPYRGNCFEREAYRVDDPGC